MVSTRVVLTSVVLALLSAPLLRAQDLSVYREFQFGMKLTDVARRAEVKPSEARLIHERPAIIQELEWRPQRAYISAKETDPVRQVLFSFFNGELFRVLVTYDQEKTQGMTNQDMVEAISVLYGAPTSPADDVVLFSSSSVYNNSEKVIARWEDSQYSFNLFRTSYNSAYGMAAFSKGVNALAQKAIIEAIRMDEKEAPAREIQRKQRLDDENRLAQDKARPGNKANFRP